MNRFVLFGSILLAALGGFLLYRLGAELLRPDNLYRTCHIGWVLGLFAWSLYAGVLARSPRPGDAVAGRRQEQLLLGGCSLLLFAAFVLAGQGRLLGGNPAWQVLPFLPLKSVLVQSVMAAGIVVTPLWLCHLLLQRLLPLRSPLLLPLVSMLSGIGLVLLFRLGPDIAIKRQAVGFTYLFWNQYISFIVSILAFVVSLFLLTPQRLERLTRKPYIYALGCVVLISVTALIGKEMHGRRLSINLGVMNFQTVELVKLLALFFMVSYFRLEGTFLERGRSMLGLPRARYLLPYLIMWVVVLLPIFLQKDLGPTALLFALFLIMFYLGTGSTLSVLTGLVLMAIAGGVSYHLGFPSMVRTRLDMWFEPFLYSQNMAESLWAVSSGGWFGSGAATSMAYKIPVVWSDFNFTALTEEWGLLGGATVLLCFGLLMYVCLRMAGRCREPYLQLLAAGIGGLWMMQTLVIVGGNLALLPLTGITLPFISFGGSSLIINFVALALMLHLSALALSADAPTRTKDQH